MSRSQTVTIKCCSWAKHLWQIYQMILERKLKLQAATGVSSVFCWGIKLMYIYSSQTSYISLDINYTYNRLLVHVKLYTPGRLYKINCCFLGPYLTIHYAPLSLLLVELLMTFYQISNSQTVHQNLSQLIYTNITYFSFHKLPNLLSL